MQRFHRKEVDGFLRAKPTVFSCYPQNPLINLKHQYEKHDHIEHDLTANNAPNFVSLSDCFYKIKLIAKKMALKMF